METLLSCDIRNEIGSNGCNRVRSRGHIPGVIYGHYFSNYPLEFDRKELNRLISNHGENALVNVSINGITYPAMIKEVQRDPVTGEIIHIDLQQVYATEKIHTSVPIMITGRKNLSKDTIIQQQLNKVDIECYPTNVPKYISVDVSGLPIGKSIKIQDVEFGEEISVLNDEREIILSLSLAKEMDEDEEIEEEDTFMVQNVAEDMEREEKEEDHKE